MNTNRQKRLHCNDVLLLFLLNILFPNIYGQTNIDSIINRHVFYTEPIGYLYKDIAIGYEYKMNNKKSLTLCFDLFLPRTKVADDFYIENTITELELYQGISIRSGLKFRKGTGFYHSFGALYRISGYNDKYLLRKNYEGQAADIFYLESRLCNSIGINYNLGYEFNKYHIFICPFLSVGIRTRYDIITIHGKYDWRHDLISDIPETKYKIWPIPMFKIGFLFGFAI